MIGRYTLIQVQNTPEGRAPGASPARDARVLPCLIEQLVEAIGLQHHLELLRPVRGGLRLPAGEARPVGRRVRVVGAELLHVHGEEAHPGELVRRQIALDALRQVLLHVAEDDERAGARAAFLEIFRAQHHRAADVGMAGVHGAVREALQLARKGELLRIRPGGTDVEVEIGLDVVLLVALAVDADDVEAVARHQLREDAALDDVHHVRLLVGIRARHVDEGDHRLRVVTSARAGEETGCIEEQRKLLHRRPPSACGRSAPVPSRSRPFPFSTIRSICSGMTMRMSYMCRSASAPWREPCASRRDTVPKTRNRPAASASAMWPPVAISVSSGTATIARMNGRMKPRTAWPTTGMRDAAGSATVLSETPASALFSAVAEATICSRSTASEHSMPASSTRPPSDTTRIRRRRDEGRFSSLGKKLVTPSISIAKMPAAISMRTITSAATVETGRPPMRLPEGTSSLIGRAMRLKFTNAPPMAMASTSRDTTKSCVEAQPTARMAFGSDLRIFSYDSM